MTNPVAEAWRYLAGAGFKEGQGGILTSLFALRTDFLELSKRLDMLAERVAVVVPPPGLEPGPPARPHFECGASTNSAKGANSYTFPILDGEIEVKAPNQRVAIALAQMVYWQRELEDQLAKLPHDTQRGEQR